MRRAKSHGRNFMTVKRERNAGTLKPGRAIAAMALFFTLSGVEQLPAQQLPARAEEKQPMAAENKFYCNTKALNPAKRARHKQMTDKLAAKTLNPVLLLRQFRHECANLISNHADTFDRLALGIL